jgi:type II secretory pathway component PulF
MNVINIISDVIVIFVVITIIINIIYTILRSKLIIITAYSKIITKISLINKIIESIEIDLL